MTTEEGRCGPPQLMPMTRFVSLVCVLLVVLPVSAAPGAPAVIRVEMQEFTFHPSAILLTARRPVSVILMNHGQIAHQFDTGYLRQVPVRVADGTLTAEVSGLEVLRVQPGAAATVEFVPRQRGRFIFACTIEGHREAGMHGLLEVR